MRRIIEDGSVPLLKSWSNFVALNENRADLPHFVSSLLMVDLKRKMHAVNCSSPNIDIRALEGFHEEADTRVILHCVHSDAEFLVVSCQDRDVFLLLVSHLDKIKQLWMRAGA